MRARERDPGKDAAVAAAPPTAGARQDGADRAALGAVPSPGALGPRQVLALQNSAGNAAAARLLDRRARPRSAPGGLAPIPEEGTGGSADTGPVDTEGPVRPVRAQSRPDTLAPIPEEETDGSADTGPVDTEGPVRPIRAQHRPGTLAPIPEEETDGSADTRPAVVAGPGRSGRRRGAGRGRRTAPAVPPGGPAPGLPQPPPLVLPPYLLDMTSAGLSTASGLKGHEFVGHAVSRATGADDGQTSVIGHELAGRPETFYGAGRAFAVRGKDGPYDVTVAVTRDAAREPAPTLFPNPAAPQAPATAANTGLQDPATKVDHLHTSSGTVASDAVRARQTGISASGTLLLPAAPGVWAGAQFAASGALTSTQDSHTTRTVSEPRTLRSAGGSVRAPRQVTYTVRVVRQDAPGRPRTFTGAGSLTMHVPSEHLVPLGTARPAHGPALSPARSRAVRLATSTAVLSVEDPGGPHAGGGGLFDAVASVLHPSVTAPGAPGRARLYEATAGATVLQDLGRYLAGWVPGEDLQAKDGGGASAYRMRADVLSLAPGWAAGQTQLRTHQQAQHAAGTTTGKGVSGGGGAGPAVAFGAPAAGPVLRFQGIAHGSLKRARFSAADGAVATRQGAEVRGDKVLYRGRIRLTVQGSGPASPAMAVAGHRTAHHTLDAWVSLRAEEAGHLGLPLPPGTTPGELYSRPTETAPDGTTRPVERHLPFDAMGSSTALTHLDTRPLIAALEQLFATSPRLAGYLPGFEGPPRVPGGNSRAEAEQQRRNHRELVTVLSETNLRANKDQLLSGGIPVRLRRKTALTSHDVQIRVKGSIGEVTYLGDTADWLVRSSSGISTSGQTGRSGARQAGVRGNMQMTVIPGVLSFGVTADAAVESGRTEQGGPTTRTDSLNSGSTSTSTFGTRLRFGVQVTMTSRDRTLKRAVTPGSPGRDEPEAEVIASTDAGTTGRHLAFEGQGQDVRLSSPTALTVDADTRRALDRRARGGHRAHPLGSEGIGALSGAAARGDLRDWDFVETVGDGRDIQNLAFELLGRAARKGRTDKDPDTAYEAEGLAPRLAVEDRFSPQAVTGALRQGVDSGWVISDLRHPRRLAGLHGAVGTRFALTAPRVVLKSTGAGMENMALGGHQASGQRSRTRSKGVTFNGAGSQKGEAWSLGESASYHHGTAVTDARSTSLGGTVERNAVNPRTEPLFLVQCNLGVRMAAEVKVNGLGPYVAAGQRTLLGAVAVWLTTAQLRAAGLEDPEAARAADDGAATAETATTANGGSTTTAAATADGGTAAATAVKGGSVPGPVAAAPEGARDTGDGAGAPPGVPALAAGQPLGLGLIEELPDFVPLLNRLRAAVGDRGLARDLLPATRLDDPFDNVQRLLRVLDRDGVTALLASAMDGGVPVELLRNSGTPGRRATPYWAVLRLRRQGAGAVVGPGGDRDMEYSTVATAQSAESHRESETHSVEGSFTGSGKPHDDAVGSAGAVAAPAVGSTDSGQRTAVGRGQIGLRTVVDTSQAQSKVAVPFRVDLELLSKSGQLASVGFDSQFVFRTLSKDLTALARAEQARPVATGQGNGTIVPGGHRVPAGPAVAAASPGRLRGWREDGAALPPAAQVNGFRGAPEVRESLGRAMAAAHVDSGFRTPGNAAHYAQTEAVSTEWLMSALPMLVSAGAELPPVHVSGVEGQDIACSLHARLLHGRVLGRSAELSFETLVRSAPDELRPTGTEHRHAAHHGRSARFSGGEGPVKADYSGMNSMPVAHTRDGGPTDAAGLAAGTGPLHKPKEESALVQFTVQFRAVARVRPRHTGRVRDARQGIGVVDHVLSVPVVVRMPVSAVRRMVAEPGGRGHVTDAHGRLDPDPPPDGTT
ncbi:hypothetical protein [Streptomyces sp. NPDC047000]|uniref:hypothetical protein n=1 Tax=Streptomyces sp. NPDC047000 TaxID=3155474 RepID=UPI0033C7C9C0